MAANTRSTKKTNTRTKAEDLDIQEEATEVAADVIDGPQSAVFQQGHNRMHAARGVLAFLSGVTAS